MDTLSQTLGIIGWFVIISTVGWWIRSCLKVISYYTYRKRLSTIKAVAAAIRECVKEITDDFLLDLKEAKKKGE